MTLRRVEGEPSAMRAIGSARPDPCPPLAGAALYAGGTRIRVEVYGKRGCCLCEEAETVLHRVRRDVPFDLLEIDIESAPELYERFKERIPLVVVNGRLAFKFRIDEAALRRRLHLIRLESPPEGGQADPRLSEGARRPAGGRRP